MQKQLASYLHPKANNYWNFDAGNRFYDKFEDIPIGTPVTNSEADPYEINDQESWEDLNNINNIVDQIDSQGRGHTKLVTVSEVHVSQMNIYDEDWRQ